MGAPGCDDAPVFDVLLTWVDRPVTLIYPYYENPQFLEIQVQNWLSYTPRIHEKLHVIVVDDCSQKHPAQEVLSKFVGKVPFDLRLFRIGVDIRWNWLAARNIGAHHAETKWIALTDMDHVFTQDAIVALVSGEFSEHTIYRFSRKEHDGRLIHPHPNSWFMTRDMYWRVGGYDETFSGYYGTDGEYRRRCAATAPIMRMSTPLVRYEYFIDSSTLHYKRKQPEDAAVKQIIRARRPGWTPKTLSFPYTELLQC